MPASAPRIGARASSRAASATYFRLPTVTQIERGDQVYASPSKPLSFSTVLRTAVSGVG